MTWYESIIFLQSILCLVGGLLAFSFPRADAAVERVELSLAALFTLVAFQLSNTSKLPHTGHDTILDMHTVFCIRYAIFFAALFAFQLAMSDRYGVDVSDDALMIIAASAWLLPTLAFYWWVKFKLPHGRKLGKHLELGKRGGKHNGLIHWAEQWTPEAVELSKSFKMTTLDAERDLDRDLFGREKKPTGLYGGGSPSTREGKMVRDEVTVRRNPAMLAPNSVMLHAGESVNEISHAEHSISSSTGSD